MNAALVPFEVCPICAADTVEPFTDGVTVCPNCVTKWKQESDSEDWKLIMSQYAVERSGEVKSPVDWMDETPETEVETDVALEGNFRKEVESNLKRQRAQSFTSWAYGFRFGERKRNIAISILYLLTLPISIPLLVLAYLRRGRIKEGDL